MAVRVSTGFAQAILGTSSFAGIFHNGVIEVRSGAQPASADDPATGVLLARVTRDGLVWEPGSTTAGLQFQQNGRYVGKSAQQVWLLQGLAAGTAGWFRLKANAADNDVYSIQRPRIDGAVGLTSSTGDVQMYMPNLAITPSTLIPQDSWWYAIPPLQ